MKNTPLKPDAVKSLYSRVEQEIHRLNYWWKFNWIMNDWFYGISLFISVLTPFAFAMVLYVPDLKYTVNITALIVTGIGGILSLIRSIFRFRERTDRIIERMNKGQTILDILTIRRNISETELVQMLHEFEEMRLHEPRPE